MVLLRLLFSQNNLMASYLKYQTQFLVYHKSWLKFFYLIIMLQTLTTFLTSSNILKISCFIIYSSYTSCIPSRLCKVDYRFYMALFNCEQSSRIDYTEIQAFCFYSELIFLKLSILRKRGERVSVMDFYFLSRHGRLTGNQSWFFILLNQMQNKNISNLQFIFIIIMNLSDQSAQKKIEPASSKTLEAEKQQVQNTKQETIIQQNGENKSCSSEQVDHYANDSPLPKSKPFDLKALWLGDTQSSLQKFDAKYKQLKISQKDLKEGFKKFEENENKYKLSSLRKIEIKFDRKAIYTEYILKTRRTIEKLNPTLIINILSYVDEHLFYSLFVMRRVSKIFNQIFLNQPIQNYLAQRDYLFNSNSQMALKISTSYCKKYVKFHKTFLYYKQMQYTQQIPQNSIMKDLEQAVSFINQIHRIVVDRKNKNFHYYLMMNNFMKRHRVVIGLSSLSLTSLVMVRKPAIIAFSNYLAFNQQERSKEQITKTKYSKVISVVQFEDYKQSLIINTKVSNYLWENYRLNFAVLVLTHGTPINKIFSVKSWNILVYHLHNQEKAIYLQNIQLIDNKFTSARLDLMFEHDMTSCYFSTVQYMNWVKLEAQAKYMDIILSPLDQTHEKNFMKFQEQSQQFSYCFFYHLQQYYVIAFPSLTS